MLSFIFLCLYQFVLCQLCLRGPIYTYPCQFLALLICFYEIVILMIFFSLIYSDVAQLLISLAFQMSSSLNCLLMISFSKVFPMVAYIFLLFYRYSLCLQHTDVFLGSHCFTFLIFMLTLVNLVKFIYIFSFWFEIYVSCIKKNTKQKQTKSKELLPNLRP